MTYLLWIRDRASKILFILFLTSAMMLAIPVRTISEEGSDFIQKDVEPESCLITLDYPPSTETRYSGMIKPIRSMPDYNGTLCGTYQTTWTGRYPNATLCPGATCTNSGEGSGGHEGVDIGGFTCQVTPVRAVAAGEIVAFYRDWETDNPGRNPCGNNMGVGIGWGNYVVIRHENFPILVGSDGNAYGGQGPFFSVYAHLTNVPQDLVVGHRVMRGTLLGYFGSTGNSTGPHLHFQMDRSPPGPSGPYSCQCDRCNSANAATVAANTFHPMYFVQAHEVKMQFAANTGSYYSGTNFDYFLKSQNDPEIDFEWFNGSPQGVPVDSFSVRWQGTLNLAEASWYTFYTTSDDGVRLWVDNKKIIDKWLVQSPHTYSTIRWLTAGNHDVTVEYFENSGGAMVQVAWQKMPSFTGYYWSNSETFNNWTYADPTLIRQDPSPFNFHWYSGSPAPSVSSDSFSVRWLGKIHLPSGGWRRFHVWTDDGIQLRVDGRIVIHRWLLQGDTHYWADTWLSGGSHSLEVRFYEHAGAATAQLWWEQSAGTVPGSRTGGNGVPRYGGGQQTNDIYDVKTWRPAEFYWGVDHIDVIHWIWNECGTYHYYAEGWHNGDEAEYLMMLGGGYYTDLTIWAKEDYPPPLTLRIWIDGQNKGTLAFSDGNNCNGTRTIRLDDPDVWLNDDIHYGPHAVSIEFSNDAAERDMYLDGLKITSW